MVLDANGGLAHHFVCSSAYKTHLQSNKHHCSWYYPVLLHLATHTDCQDLAAEQRAVEACAHIQHALTFLCHFGMRDEHNFRLTVN